MTGREKIEAALSPGGSGETPAVICYEGIYIRDHWDQLTSCPWWYQFSPDLRHQLAWRRDFLAATPQDWFHLPACASRAEREATGVEDGPDGVFLVNRRTGRRHRLTRPAVSGWDPDSASLHPEPSRLPQTVEQVDAEIGPGGEFDAGRFDASGRGDLAAAMLDEFGKGLLPTASVSSPLWGCYGLWGFEGMMIMVAERPDLVRHACRRLLAARLRSVQEAAALGAAGVWIEECFTDLISPAAFEAINVALLRRLIQEIRSAGMKSIYYYCGDPAGRWEHILSLGMDALSLEESKKGFVIDIDEVVERAAGRCAVLGNLDAIHLLPDGTEQELRAEIARQIAAGRANGGRFIMSLGSPPTPGTSVGRIRRYLELSRRLGP